MTDQKVYVKYPMFMRVKVKIGNTEEEQESALKTLKAVFQILDKIPKMKISEAAKKRAANARKSVESEKVREENEQEENEMLEKKRREQLEYNEKLKSLPPDQQKKLEDKRRKKELDATKRKMMKVVKH